MGKLKVESEECIGCGTCASLYPDIFTMKEGKAVVKEAAELSEKKIEEVTSICPVSAIVKVEENE